jgi:hypothetical protein
MDMRESPGLYGFFSWRHRIVSHQGFRAKGWILAISEIPYNELPVHGWQRSVKAVRAGGDPEERWRHARSRLQASDTSSVICRPLFYACLRFMRPSRPDATHTTSNSSELYVLSDENVQMIGHDMSNITSVAGVISGKLVFRYSAHQHYYTAELSVACAAPPPFAAAAVRTFVLSAPLPLGRSRAFPEFQRALPPPALLAPLLAAVPLVTLLRPPRQQRCAFHQYAHRWQQVTLLRSSAYPPGLPRRSHQQQQRQRVRGCPLKWRTKTHKDTDNFFVGRISG